MKTLKIPKVKYKYTFHFTVWSWNEVAANFKRRAHNPELALAYFMMFQKLESASVKLPSPQCCVISVTASPIDTHHFFKLHWMLYTWLKSCFVWRWYKIKPEIIKFIFFNDRDKIWYNFNYCSTRYFVSHASNAPLPFKSNLGLIDSQRLTPNVSELDEPGVNAYGEINLQMKSYDLNTCTNSKNSFFFKFHLRVYNEKFKLQIFICKWVSA